MPRETLSVNDIRDIFEVEGMGYAVQHYISIGSVADDKLQSMLAQAKELLNEIEQYVEDNFVPDDLDTDEDDDDGDE